MTTCWGYNSSIGHCSKLCEIPWIWSPTSQNTWKHPQNETVCIFVLYFGKPHPIVQNGPCQKLGFPCAKHVIQSSGPSSQLTSIALKRTCLPLMSVGIDHAFESSKNLSLFPLFPKENYPSNYPLWSSDFLKIGFHEQLEIGGNRNFLRLSEVYCQVFNAQLVKDSIRTEWKGTYG